MKDFTKRCRHYTGIHNESCKVGSEYVFKSLKRCWGEGTACENYSAFSTEELAAQEAEITQRLDYLKQGISPCCEAPIDTRWVIVSGSHKGHGPRFCSKCRKVLFIV